MITIDQASWIVAAASLIATVGNVKKYSWCFIIWAFTNSSWVMYDLYKGAYSQAALFFCYSCLAIWGIYEWRRSA